MSTRKRPLRELQNSQTPARYAPSTPHAIRALQQRSGAKTRTVRRRTLSDTFRPDSARGILRQLAKLTAPTTKRIIPTPGTVKGKENKVPDEEDDRLGKRPRMTLNIDDSLDSIEAPEGVDEDEDSELPVAPTPSILPDDNQDHSAIEKEDPTFTLKSIKYGGNTQLTENDQKVPRRSFPASDPVVYHDGDEDSTFLSERGRRAPTVDPTEAFSHYDFDEMNEGAERRQQSKSPEKSKFDLGVEDISYTPLEDEGGETEALKHLHAFQRSPSIPPLDETNADLQTLDESNFQLPVPEPDLEATSNQIRGDPTAKITDASLIERSPQQVDDAWESEVGSDAGPDVEPDAALGKESEAEQLVEPLLPTKSSMPSQSRRNKVKLTRHGEMIPSLPSSLIRRVAVEAQERLGNRRPKLGKDHMKALEQATEWFFEQVGEDLEAYSNHARGRKCITQSDVMLLMRRQRIFQGEGELLKAAKEFLPKEEVAKLDIPD